MQSPQLAKQQNYYSCSWDWTHHPSRLVWQWEILVAPWGRTLPRAPVLVWTAHQVPEPVRPRMCPPLSQRVQLRRWWPAVDSLCSRPCLHACACVCMCVCEWVDETYIAACVCVSEWMRCMCVCEWVDETACVYTVEVIIICRCMHGRYVDACVACNYKLVHGYICTGYTQHCDVNVSTFTLWCKCPFTSCMTIYINVWILTLCGSLVHNHFEGELWSWALQVSNV